MYTLVIRLNSINPPPRMNFPVESQPAEMTEERMQLHLNNGSKPVFDYRTGYRTDEVADLLDRNGLQLAQVKLLNRSQVKPGGQRVTRPVTLLFFSPDGGFTPNVTPDEGQTVEQANATVDRWWRKQLQRSWGGSQLWIHGDDVPITLNLLAPEALDLNHPDVPLARHLSGRLALRV